jgi:hypothetical protein
MARDILFKEFPLETSAFLSGFENQTDEELSRLFIEIEKAENEFLRKMGIKKKGMQFVQDVFETVDRLTKEWLKKNKIVCQAGCSFCCLQMVSCTYAEAELIKQHLMSLPKKQCQAIKKRVNQEAIYLHGLLFSAPGHPSASAVFNNIK